ncbi:MAG: 4'-phosphopantetheinyl transferase superfamily protein [Oscillospiraceae bacterium]|nr:4'-phosphopantetheinyl transferase superfamily protein [Oscillospiraceae bacterium]
MPRIFYCDAKKFEHLYDECLSALSQKRREKAEKLFDKKDSLLSALAGLMLINVFGKKAIDDIKYNEHGKPYFEHGACFNISHSKNYAVLAVSGDNIGIDVEEREAPDIAVAKRCFTKEEFDFAKQSTQSFLRIWTAKEAVLKLLGTGFSYSPKNFCVLPFDEEHEINGVKMRFFCHEINGVPITAAFCKDSKDFEITEFLPKDLLN